MSSHLAAAEGGMSRSLTQRRHDSHSRSGRSHIRDPILGWSMLSDLIQSSMSSHHSLGAWSERDQLWQLAVRASSCSSELSDP